jgi:hypothetical protein
MRNALALLVMALMYALSSEMDYNDAELVHSLTREILAEAACQSAPAACHHAPDGHLALNSH